MIIDDNEYVRNSLKSLIDLDDSIFICAEAATIEQAHHLLYTKKPNVIIIDLMFNGKQMGIDFIKSIKNDFPAIKIIVLSMHNKEKQVREALEAGADFFLSKEYAPEKIIELIKS